MIKKVFFYVLLILMLIFFQLYATPFFFVYSLPIFFWLGIESKEVFIFLIAAIFLDLLSSFYFGFWLALALAVFFSASFILKQYLRQWTTFTLVVVFGTWQIIYTFFYVLLSKIAWNWNLLFDFFWSLLFCLIIFLLFERTKTWLINQEIISVKQTREYII